MYRVKEMYSRIVPWLQIAFIIVWLSNLTSTDAYFSVYAIIAFAAFYLLITKGKHFGSEAVSYNVWLVRSCSLCFSVLVLLANYPIFLQVRDPALIGRSTNIMVNLINAVFSLIGGFCAAWPIFFHVFSYFPLKIQRSGSMHFSRRHGFIIFASFLCINLVHLFFVEFPGNATEDTFTQISEMVSGQYTNFNTFWHTKLFQAVLALGYGLFSDLNWAIAFFCIIQSLVMAFAFTHCLMTMLDYGVPKGFVTAAYFTYAVIPYNIALSITIWKDVLFAAGCLLMVSSWLRILKKLDPNPVWNYGVFGFGSLLFLLSRTNGWIIYLITFLIFLVSCRKDKKIIAFMGCAAVLGWLLMNPVLSLLEVPGSDLVESLSVPIQQVSRVIYDGCELTEEEEALISRVADLEDVSEQYTSWLSDPMKEELRSKDPVFFEENLDAYFRLWIRLGLKHPLSYLKAWVDQTKGYWNAGYDYFLYSETITDNPYGVEKQGGNSLIASLFRLYFGLSRHVIFFEPLHSIGLHIWIVILCFILNIVRKREEFLISVPVLLLVLGLWFGTPVYCSFRYVYPLFVSFPLIVSTAFYDVEKD